MHNFLKSGATILLSPSPGWDWSGWDGKLKVSSSSKPLRLSTDNIIIETDVPLFTLIFPRGYTATGFSDTPGLLSSLLFTVDKPTLSDKIKVNKVAPLLTKTTGRFTCNVNLPSFKAAVPPIPDPVPIKTGTWKVVEPNQKVFYRKQTLSSVALKRNHIIADVESGKIRLKGYGERKGNHKRKCNYGEMKMDQHFESLSEVNGKTVELKRISKDNTIDIDEPIKRGIDGIYENTYPPPKFIIAECKYGSSDLNPKTGDGPQMSDSWIIGSDRLEKAVGKKNIDKVDEILDDEYERVLTKVDESGKVITIKLDSNGKEIGTWP